MPLHPEMDRSQMEFFCLEELIPKDHPVRVIEAFVEGLDLEALGFKVLGKSHEGRPAFGAKSLLKLYLYGYQNGVRSSRKLEAEGGRNVELWWLLGRQQPGYKTIADFRKDNRSAFKGVFRQLVSLMRDWDLVGGKTLAIDSTKIRAQNSKKHLPRRQAGNFNKEKIDRQIAYIDGRLEEFFEEMDRLDEEDDKGGGYERGLGCDQRKSADANGSARQIRKVGPGTGTKRSEANIDYGSGCAGPGIASKYRGSGLRHTDGGGRKAQAHRAQRDHQ
ncbi:MAG: transposase [Saprospirales bacterium]|nr:transposase [Saprospirales bacterium]